MQNRLANFSRLDMNMLWDEEPDLLDLDNGEYHLVVRRMDLGYLTGYVGVTNSHPLYGQDYGKTMVKELDVHGGITFTGEFDIEPFKEKYWYIGFDAAHLMDKVPYVEMTEIEIELPSKIMQILLEAKENEEYRDFTYMVKQTDKIYRQLLEMKKRTTNTDINDNIKGE